MNNRIENPIVNIRFCLSTLKNTLNSITSFHGSFTLNKLKKKIQK
jgi:hypothetical protein